MKKSLIILLTIINCQLSIVNSAKAQSPQAIPYQAVARNASGNLIQNQNVSLRFSIHDVTASGTIVYQETQSATTNALGLFSVNIGQGTPVTGSFATINWSNGNKFTQVEIDVTGGTTYIDMGTTQMLSVPFALYANKSANGVGAGVINQTMYFDGAKWDSTSTMKLYPTDSFVNVKGTVTISNDPSYHDPRYSLQIESPKPVMLPRMTQTQINALTPVEGMTLFNSTAHKEQIYAEITDNQDILNEIYAGTFGQSFFMLQSFTPPISGQVVAIEVLIKDNFPAPFPFIDFYMPGYFQSVSIGSFPSYTWFTIILTTPQSVSAGISSSFSFDGPGVFDRDFASNSFYPDGSGCCALGADDLLFRIHIQPTPGSFGWQNLH